MKKTNFLLAAAVLFILAGCGASNDYTPAADATGEEIFSTACTGCHKPLSGSVAMILSADMANKDAILNKVKSGSMRMPSFTNIQGEAADRLADYILANSQAK